MSQAKLEDFSLDKNCNYAMETSAGMRNSQVLRLLSHLYEALMKFSFKVSNYSTEHCAHVVQLCIQFQVGLISGLIGRTALTAHPSAYTVAVAY